MDNDDRRRLASRIAQLVHGTTAPLTAWGEYFLDPEKQQADPKLAAQAFSIYFMSLYDVAELSMSHRLPKIAVEARAMGHNDIALQAEIFESKSGFALELLLTVPENLQIFVKFCRDTFVHGPLTNYSNDRVSTKIARNGKIDTPTFPRYEFDARCRPYLGSNGDFGPALSEAARLTVAQRRWIDEIQGLQCDPNELRAALIRGAVPFPWKSNFPKKP